MINSLIITTVAITLMLSTEIFIRCMTPKRKKTTGRQ